MGLLFFDGCDLYGAIADLALRYTLEDTVNSSNYALDPTGGKFGGQAIHLKGGNTDVRMTKTVSGTKILVNTYVKINETGNGAVDHRLIGFLGSGGYNFSVSWRPSTNTIKAYRGNADGAGVELAASSAINLDDGNWHHLECMLFSDGSAGTFQLRLNKVLVLDVTPTNTQALGAATITGVQFLSFNAISTEWDTYWDDIAIVDWTSGITSWMGPLRVSTAELVSDDAGNDFIPSTGSDNYALLGPPIQTTNVVEADTVDDEDLYGIDDHLADYVTAPTICYGVQVAVYAKKDGTARELQTSLKSGATLDHGTGVALLDTYQLLQKMYTTDPDTSSAWDLADIPSIMPGMKVSA